GSQEKGHQQGASVFYRTCYNHFFPPLAFGLFTGFIPGFEQMPLCSSPTVGSIFLTDNKDQVDDIEISGQRMDMLFDHFFLSISSFLFRLFLDAVIVRASEE
ncbi:MAG: hypothetical protein ACE5FY_05280, partial [Nitrospiria bacterium]